MLWNQEWHKSFSAVIPQALGSAFSLTKPGLPSCLDVHNILCVRAGLRQGGARLLIWTFWIWCIWFIWAWFPFSLGMSSPLIYLRFISLPLPKPNTRGAVNALKWGASFPAQPSPCPRPSPVQAVCQVWLHTCLVLPLLTVFPRIVSFWDAPYLFLISSVPQIELFSSSSKEVSHTFD